MEKALPLKGYLKLIEINYKQATKYYGLLIVEDLVLK